MKLSHIVFLIGLYFIGFFYRTIGNAALAIVKGYIKPVDVMQIKVPSFLMFIFEYSFHCKAHVSTNKHLNILIKRNIIVFLRVMRVVLHLLFPSCTGEPSEMLMKSKISKWS